MAIRAMTMSGAMKRIPAMVNVDMSRSIGVFMFLSLQETKDN
jgi:hypothetical protein